MNGNLKLYLLLKWIAVAFILTGIGMALINFINNRSLWIDEATLALNLTNKAAIELIKPLDYNQVAPIGFLMLTKFFGYLFNYSDWSLRLFPLLSYLISVLLFHILTRRLITEKLIALFATGFFATTANMIYFSAEIKQYSSDVTFCLILLLRTILFNESPLKLKWKHYALIGALSIWFSNVAVPLLFCYGLYQIFKTYKSAAKKYTHLFLVLGIWLFSFVVYYSFFIHHHPTKEGMVDFWTKAGAFLPQNMLSTTFYINLMVKLKEYLELMGGGKLVLSVIPIILAGLLFLAKKNKELLYLLVSPLLLHLILSYLKLYPFSSRLILYLYPTLVIILFSGLLYIGTFLKKYKQIYLLVFPFILTINFFGLFEAGFPIEREEIKKSLSYLNSRVAAEDEIYIYNGATPAFNFYKKYYASIKAAKIDLTSSHRDDWEGYKNQVLNKGNSVWILFSHVYWAKNDLGLQEDEYILNIFKEYGYQIIDEQKFTGCAIYHVNR